MRNLIIPVILFLSAPPGVIAQFLTVRAELDSNNILIGDQVKLNFIVSKSSDINITFPFIPDTLPGGVEILEHSAIDTTGISDKIINLKQSVTITSFDSGDYEIPPFAFFLTNNVTTDTIYTNPLTLSVRTIPVDTTKNTIYDIKAPFDEPFSLMEIIEYIIYGALTILLILLLIYVYRRYKRKEPLIKLPEKPAEPPHVTALRELDALKNRKLWQNNQIKKYHTELTEIIRKYIESRFGVGALEMTSYEILEEISREKYLSVDIITELRKMLTVADFVKFAKATPLPDENDMSMRYAYNFVNNTVPIQQPASGNKEAVEEGGENE